MKIVFQLFLILITHSLLSQNIWEPISFPDSLRPKTINAEKEDTLFVGVGGQNEYNGLLRSFDDGLNWEYLHLDSIPHYENIISIGYNENGYLFVGSGIGIYRSSNDGNSFEKVQPDVWIRKFNTSPSGEFYAVGGKIIERTIDDGDTWDTLLFISGNIHFADIDFGLNGEIYTVGGSFDGPGTGSGFHRSLDNGETWENIGIVDLHLGSIEVNSSGVIIVGGESANIYRSNDGGENWTYISDSNPSTMESDSQDNLFAGVRGFYYDGCMLSEDWGDNWAELNDTILNPYINQISISPNNTVYLQCDYVENEQYQLFKSINPILSLENKLSISEIELFPNPVNNKLSIVNKANEKILKCNIYNLNGQKVQSYNNLNNKINVSKLKSGLYIVELVTENRIISNKIVIE